MLWQIRLLQKSRRQSVLARPLLRLPRRKSRQQSRGRKPKAAAAAAKKAEGPKKPTALIIMDGFGHREETKGNAIEAAKKPNLG